MTTDDTLPPVSPSRRGVLAAAGAAVAGAGVLTACGDDGTAATPAASPSSSPAGGSGAAGTKIVALAEVPVGGAVAATGPSGEKLLVTQPTEGKVVAFSSTCTHKGCVVAPGTGTLVCPCHGSAFTLEGQVEKGPATAPLASFAVAVKGSDVVSA